MFLDDLIVALVEIICLLVEGVITASVGIINLLAWLAEISIGLFITGFKLGRIKRPERNETEDTGSATSQAKANAKPTWLPPRVSLIIFSVTLGLVIFVLASEAIMNRKITLFAKDGHALPYAILIVHTKDGYYHKLADKSGTVRIPRFSTTALTVNDPRYVETTWQESQITRELTVGRSLLGSSFDTLADHLRQHSKDKNEAKANPKD